METTMRKCITKAEVAAILITLGLTFSVMASLYNAFSS